jgi:hypothetical protein
MSALPTITPRRGRIRRASSISAAGELSLRLLARNGEAEPANVVRLNPPPEPTPIERSPELVLILSLFCSLPSDHRDRIKGSLRSNAADTKDPHFIAASALLNGGEHG